MKQRMVLVAFMLFLAACSYHEMKQAGFNPQAPQDVPLGIDFEMIRSEILENPNTGKCNDCHFWTGSYEQVHGRLDKIQDRISRAPGSRGFMPKDNPPLPVELKELLFVWIEEGAPQ